MSDVYGNRWCGLVLMVALAGSCSARGREPAWQQPLDLARMANERGDLAGAERDLERAVRAAGDLTAEHLPILEELNVLGALQSQRVDLGSGERTVRRALDLAERAVGSTSPSLEPFLSMLGTLRLQQGRAPEALELLRRSYAILEPRLPPGDPSFSEVIRNYAEAARRCGRTDEVTRLSDLYGYLVDLSPQGAAAAPSTAPAARTVAPPAAPSVPSPQAAPGEGPEPSRQMVLRALNNLAMHFSHLPHGMAKAREARRWVRKQIRRFDTRRTYKVEVIRQCHRTAMQMGYKLAQMALVASGIRRLVTESRVKEMATVFEHKEPQVVRYEEAIAEVVADLKHLFELLAQQLGAPASS